MKQIKVHINLFLLCLNIVGLTTYCHLAIDRDTSLSFLPPFFLAFLPIEKNPNLIRVLYCVISLLSIGAVFIEHNLVSVLTSSCALGLALTLGYHLTNQMQHFSDEQTVKIYEGALNLAICIGVVFSVIATLFKVSIVAVKAFILITTVANIYLPRMAPIYRFMKLDPIRNKAGYAMVPFYIHQQSYAIGYAIGIYLNIFDIFTFTKQAKYLVVSGLVLLEMMTYKQQIVLISQFLRAVLIFHFEVNTKQIQAFFVLIFTLLRLYFHENSINIYLALGYAVLAIVLWREQFMNPNRGDQRDGRETAQIEMRLLSMTQRQRYTRISNNSSNAARDFNE